MVKLIVGGTNTHSPSAQRGTLIWAAEQTHTVGFTESWIRIKHTQSGQVSLSPSSSALGALPIPLQIPIQVFILSLQIPELGS